MNLTEELKQEVIRLVLQNKKNEASDYLCRSLDIDSFQAGLLVAAVENEINTKQDSTILSADNQSIKPIKKGGCLKVGALIALIITGILTLIFLGGAVYYYFYQQDYIKSFVAGSGEVVALSPDSLNKESLAPLISYKFNDQNYSYQGTLYSNPAEYTIGQEVPLLINPASPDKVLIDSNPELYGALYGLLFIGGFFMVFAIIFLLVFRKF